MRFVQGDVQKEKIHERISKYLNYEKADIIVSDAVPDFIGNKFIELMKAVELNRMVVSICDQMLRPGGNLLMKIIMGPAEEQLTKEILMQFQSYQRVKPAASRQESAEIYLLCKNYDFSEDPIA